MRLELKLAVAVGCSLMAASASWATVEINVSHVEGTGMHSYAYGSGGGALASTSWAGSWTCVVQSGGTSPLPAPGYRFTGFCTDLGNTMNNGTWAYEPLAFSPVSTTTPEGIPPDPNWADSMAGQKAAWIYNTYIGSVVNADTRSAMCIAIWEALYEGSGVYDVRYRGSATTADDNATSTFYATGSSTVLNQANTWLAAGVAANWAGYNFTWFAERETPDVQSLAGPWNAVPEPTTMIAGALLLLPFGASTLRMLRKSRAA